jgi:protein involved in polysaccharide export with SLBB domain
VQRNFFIGLTLFLFFFLLAGAAQDNQQQQPDSQQQPQQTQQQPSQQSQAQPQEAAAPAADFTADQIIEILQSDPQLLADAKTEIVNRLRERGYAITESDVTDERLFSQIQTDDRVRQVMSDELRRRGYTPPVDENAAKSTTQKPANNPATANNRNRPSDARRMENRDMQKEGNPQRYYPYRNFPALQDLYAQPVNNTDKLERFGAALFRNSNVSDKTSMDVPAGADYVLGPGDGLVIDVSGSSAQRIQATVDRQGRVLLPEAGSILVLGRTLGEAQQMIQQALTRQFKGISVDVSLGKLRTIRAYIVGDVNKPGAYDISSLSTALSALLVAGGPNDTGSLRTVKHFRGKNLVEEVDLYELMLKGVSSGEVRLESGDSILVPPVGPQVTVAGMVRRPAIYELRHEQTLDQALELAGGVLVSGELGNIKVERIQAHERKIMLSVNLPNGNDIHAMEDAFKKFPIKDGDRITITPILPYSDKTVYLQGHVFRPGKYPYRDGLKVTDIVGTYEDLLPEPAARAEIVRLRPPDFRPFVIGFNLRDVLDKKREAPVLQPFDTIRIFGRYEADAPKVSVYGEVLRPGEYPMSEHMTAADLLKMAGGFKRGAFTDSADLASYSIVNGSKVELEHRPVPIARALSGEADTDVLLKPGDVLTVSQLGGWGTIGGAISVTGEILHPGRYGIQEGERLSTILKRAGGFLPGAYPNGAVLERDQVREISSKNRDELVRKLQAQGLEGDGTGRPEPVAMQRQRQQLIDKLRQVQPSGRMLIHISPDISKWENTIADIEVRAGDTLIIPRRPNFILVAGQVFNPTAITYSPGKHAGWYLQQSGGPNLTGSRKDVFIVRANGTVVGRNRDQWFSGNVLSTTLQPGDTVYVPEKIASGANKLATFAQTAQLLSGLAVAATVVTNF